MAATIAHLTSNVRLAFPLHNAPQRHDSDIWSRAPHLLAPPPWSGRAGSRYGDRWIPSWAWIGRRWLLSVTSARPLVGYVGLASISSPVSDLECSVALIQTLEWAEVEHDNRTGRRNGVSQLRPADDPRTGCTLFHPTVGIHGRRVANVRHDHRQLIGWRGLLSQMYGSRVGLVAVTSQPPNANMPIAVCTCASMVSRVWQVQCAVWALLCL